MRDVIIDNNIITLSNINLGFPGIIICYRNELPIGYITFDGMWNYHKNIDTNYKVATNEHLPNLINTIKTEFTNLKVLEF